MRVNYRIQQRLNLGFGWRKFRIRRKDCENAVHEEANKILGNLWFDDITKESFPSWLRAEQDISEEDG